MQPTPETSPLPPSLVKDGPAYWYRRAREREGQLIEALDTLKHLRNEHQCLREQHDDLLRRARIAHQKIRTRKPSRLWKRFFGLVRK